MIERVRRHYVRLFVGSRNERITERPRGEGDEGQCKYNQESGERGESVTPTASTQSSPIHLRSLGRWQFYPWFVTDARLTHITKFFFDDVEIL